MTNTTVNPIVEKIKKLLAHAASTTFEAEAQAFAERAQALIEEHAIAEADLRESGAAVGEVISVDYLIPAPAARAHASLLTAIATHNAVKAVVFVGRGVPRGKMRLFGTETAIHGTIAVFESLRLQIARELAATPPMAYALDGMQKYRNSFVLLFAHRLGQRMALVRAAAKKAADSNGAPDRGGLVLLDEMRRSEEKFRQECVVVRKARTMVSSTVGAIAGQEAADRADFGQRRMDGSRSPAIGSGV